MKERPILFSGSMVRAILEGRKTQTRRVVKGTALRMLEDGFTAEYVADPGNSAWSPYGTPGDRLWVRETFRLRADQDVKPPSQDWWKAGAWYCADGGDEPSGCGGGAGKKRPAIHMPRWASRITLEITDVCVQRLQEISEEDAKAEGLHVQIGDAKAGHCWDGPGYHDHVSRDQFGRTYHVPRGEFCCCHAGQKLKLTPARCAYRILWESINAKRGFGWDVNPWVWAITFRRLED